MNKQVAQHENDKLHAYAKKQLIIEALKQGPARADEIARRIGDKRSDAELVKLLHEMEDDMEITFSWYKGYSV